MTTSKTMPAPAAAGTITLGGDLTVNRMGFGAMRLTGKGIWGPPRSRPEAIRVLQRAVDLGVNFFDTADSYGPHIAEELIAEALYPYPGLVIATKSGLERPGPDKWVENGRPSISAASSGGVFDASAWSESISGSCTGSTQGPGPRSSSRRCGSSNVRA